MPCARGCGVGWCVRCVGGGCSCAGAWVREAAGVCVCVGGWVVSVDGECVESKAGDQVREPLAGNTCVCGVVFAVCLCEGWQSVRLCDGKVGGGVGERPRRRPCSACPCAPEFQNLQTMFVHLRADPFFTRPYSLWGSNPRPMAHKTIALTTELREHLQCMCGAKTHWIYPVLAVHEGEYPDHH